jgi:hypothetical protein
MKPAGNVLGRPELRDNMARQCQYGLGSARAKPPHIALSQPKPTARSGRYGGIGAEILLGGNHAVEPLSLTKFLQFIRWRWTSIAGWRTD